MVSADTANLEGKLITQGGNQVKHLDASEQVFLSYIAGYLSTDLDGLKPID